MYLWLLVFLTAAFSATLSCVGAECDMDKARHCHEKIVFSNSLKETCRLIQEAADCLKDAITDCPDVSESMLQDALKNVTQVTNTMGCQDLNSQSADCDVSSIEQCKGTITSVQTLEEFCKLSDDVIRCMTQQTRSCPDSIKDISKSATDQIYGLRKEKGCSGITAVMSSLALCLQLSFVAYFLSRFTN